MLVGYEANNPLRKSQEIGEFGRNLIERLASGHVGSYRALLFSTRISDEFRGYFSGYSNISTYLPVGFAKTIPEAWFRYRLNPLLKAEKVKIFHGLNEELPYGIGRDIKTIITCYGPGYHNRNSFLDFFLWKFRLKYSFRASDVIVAVSDEVKEMLVSKGVNPEKIEVIGVPGKPFEITDEIVERYRQVYNRLVSNREDD